MQTVQMDFKLWLDKVENPSKRNNRFEIENNEIFKGWHRER